MSSNYLAKYPDKVVDMKIDTSNFVAYTRNLNDPPLCPIYISSNHFEVNMSVDKIKSIIENTFRDFSINYEFNPDYFTYDVSFEKYLSKFRLSIFQNISGNIKTIELTRFSESGLTIFSNNITNDDNHDDDDDDDTLSLDDTLPLPHHTIHDFYKALLHKFL